jgi:hypothetical protein
VGQPWIGVWSTGRSSRRSAKAYSTLPARSEIAGLLDQSNKRMHKFIHSFIHQREPEEEQDTAGNARVAVTVQAAPSMMMARLELSGCGMALWKETMPS